MMLKKIFVTITLSLLANIAQSALPTQTTPTQDTLLAKKLIGLASDGKFMDLKVVSQTFDDPNIYGNAIFQTSQFSPNQLSNLYEPTQSKWGLTSVSHTIFLDMGSGFSQVSGRGEFGFNHCPSLQTFEQVSGGKVTKFNMPISPHAAAEQRNTYLTHMLTFNNGHQQDMDLYIVYQENKRCEVSMRTGEKKLEP